jgi:hypothetical protein
MAGVVGGGGDYIKYSTIHLLLYVVRLITGENKLIAKLTFSALQGGNASKG